MKEKLFDTLWILLVIGTIVFIVIEVKGCAETDMKYTHEYMMKK